jgi:hypothetical protein
VESVAVVLQIRLIDLMIGQLTRVEKGLAFLKAAAKND